MPDALLEFQRFTAPDATAHAASIAAHRDKLAAAEQAGDDLALVDATADLATLLTTARCEAQALALLEGQRRRAERLPHEEPTGWFWNAYATALQYAGRRDEANAVFARALALCEVEGWQRLQGFVLQHWGRCLAEQGDLDAAQQRFEAALALRRALNDPRATITEQALAALAERRAAHC